MKRREKEKAMGVEQQEFGEDDDEICAGGDETKVEKRVPSRTKEPGKPLEICPCCLTVLQQRLFSENVQVS